MVILLFGQHRRIIDTDIMFSVAVVVMVRKHSQASLYCYNISTLDLMRTTFGVEELTLNE